MSNDTPLLPARFVSRLEMELGPQEAGLLVAALDAVPPVSIRFNPYKTREKPEGRQVPWCRYGFYLDERPLFTADPLFHAGVYYVQEAGSMFIEYIFRQLFPDEENREPLRILDLCAAPGGKSTLLSSLAGLESLVVANEVIRPRAKILSENVQKWGLGNVAVTCADPSQFAALPGMFDLVVVDAPCSGEGMFRKNKASRSEWSEDNVALCAARQRRILADVWGSLKEGGVLIYSTCTFNRAENEDNVEWLCSEYGCETVEITGAEDMGIVCGRAGKAGTFRFYPHKTQSEGFFAAVVRKSGSVPRKHSAKLRKTSVQELPKALRQEAERWCAQPQYMRFGTVGEGRLFGYYDKAYDLVNLIADNIPVIYSGVEMGQLIRGELKPIHPLAMFHDLSREVVPEADLETADALKLLGKAELSPTLFEEGLNIATYCGVPIGWVKRIGGRCNNLYPSEWRILRNLEEL